MHVQSLIAMRRLVAVLIIGVVGAILLYRYVISSYPEFSSRNNSLPRCMFANQLTVFMASGLHQYRLRTVLPSPSNVTLTGQATVFYVWCGVRRRPFEFRNYLSVRSALRILQPDTIWFYYESEPVIDGKLYNTWLQELIDDVPFFHRQNLRDIGSNLPVNACDGPGRPSVNFVYALVSSRGGTFVEESTIVVARPRHDGVTIADRRLPCSSVASNTTVRLVECPSESTFIDANSMLCVHIAQPLYPKDIWTLDSDIGRLLRQEFYGRPDIITVSPSFDRLAPNIGHVIWLGGNKMDFLFFLCVLSLLHVAKVDMVYIHGDKPPTGIYWDLLMHSRQKVHIVRRENTQQVYGHAVRKLAHVSDVWRADIMIKYGGIYSDTDVIFVRPVSKELRAYDAVVSYDWTAWDLPFPEILNLGVAVSKPGARFWELCLKTMKWFRDDDWTWNGCRQPYRVMERHPDIVHVEPHLQVICFSGLCHPTWWPNYHDERVNHLKPPELPLDWRKDTIAIHFTYPVPPELRKPRALLDGYGMYAEMGRMILEAAGMVKHFQ